MKTVNNDFKDIIKYINTFDISNIEIEDNGLGIPNHMIEKIFEPFVSRSTNGTGLGLALVSKVISTHNGMINVTSDKAGTIFTISLPVY